MSARRFGKRAIGVARPPFDQPAAAGPLAVTPLGYPADKAPQEWPRTPLAEPDLAE